jgi:hypothetical protein
MKLLIYSIPKCEKKREELIGYDNKFKSEISQSLKKQSSLKTTTPALRVAKILTKQSRKIGLRLASTKAKELTSALNKLSLELSATEEKLSSDKSVLEQVRQWQQKQSANIQVITHIQNSINSQQTDINNLLIRPVIYLKLKMILNHILNLKIL